MALQGDGQGIVIIPIATATGDFSLVFSSLELQSGVEIVFGDSTATNQFVACFTGGEIRSRLSGSNTTNNYDGTPGEIIKYEINRVGSTVTQLINDTPISSDSISTDFILDVLFTYGDGGFEYNGILAGTLSMVGFSGGGSRLYNLEGTGTTLVDTISGLNGTLSGFNTGGFTTPAPSGGITITSVVNHESRQRNGSSQAIFTIAGDITDGTATTVEYRLDSGSWLTLDASPSATYTGQVTVTNEQSVFVRWSNDTGITATVQKLKAAACIVIAPAQSNAISRVINAQTFTVTGGNPTPAMYISGVFSALTDPTGLFAIGGMDGSLWPYIAKQYSDLGIPVCFGNVAKGGTTISQWVKSTGTLYPSLSAFADACGGLEFAISLIGESDSTGGTSTASFKADYIDVATSINTDYGCDIYAVYFPVASGTGSAGQVAAIRLAYDEAIVETAFINFGGDLSVIDISSAADPLNDNLHIKTDAAALEASQIIYAALTSVFSTLNLTATGYPDGTYSAEYYEATSPLTHVKTENVTFASGAAVATIPLAAGNTIYTRIDGSTPPSTGVTCYGVTV